MNVYPVGHRNSRCKICKAGLAALYDFLHYYGYSYADIVEDFGDLVHPKLNIVNLSNHYNAITPAGKAFWVGMVDDVKDFDRAVRLVLEFYGEKPRKRSLLG